MEASKPYLKTKNHPNFVKDPIDSVYSRTGCWCLGSCGSAQEPSRKRNLASFTQGFRVRGIDWKCVCYMISEIQYGGRITDDLDLRLMATFARTFFQERIFQLEFELAPGYLIPRMATVGQYMQFIQSLPSRDSPEAFRLHPNADIE
ncbi:unnamed protein product [Protopolystoma xenopodis]|uniref:Dynein heavy chain AAA lid domain-containing protein n=1 Tax=Protopolystoma xenopodis TaxID=117903 RepID=A0A448X0U9_9PLAT|nr:unnamed protein product [Protopolystoma xenopodis]